MLRRDLSTVFLLIVLCAGLMLPACGQVMAAPVQDVPGGEPGRGHDAIIQYGCGACHSIPGIRGANGAVGPPLDGFANRRFIAGELPNQPDNLVKWIMNPQSVEPGTAMPNLSISEATARDIAAYIYTLK